jgi:hypothetical protein
MPTPTHGSNAVRSRILLPYKCDIDEVLLISYGPCRSNEVETVGVPYRFSASRDLEHIWYYFACTDPCSVDLCPRPRTHHSKCWEDCTCWNKEIYNARRWSYVLQPSWGHDYMDSLAAWACCMCTHMWWGQEWHHAFLRQFEEDDFQLSLIRLFNSVLPRYGQCISLYCPVSGVLVWETMSNLQTFLP